jgi:hypothetical protein
VSGDAAAVAVAMVAAVAAARLVAILLVARSW